MADRYRHGDRVHRVTMAERRPGNGLVVVMIVAVALIAAIAFFLFQQQARQHRQSAPVITAPPAVGDAARDVERAINAAGRGKPQE